MVRGCVMMKMKLKWCGEGLLGILLCIGLISNLGCGKESGNEGTQPPAPAAPARIGMDISSASRIRVLAPGFLLDPQLTIMDIEAPAWLFDGRGGGLIPGTGWTPVSTDGGYFSFVEGGKALLYFQRPQNTDLGLFCRLRGIPSKKGKKQMMTVILNGHSMAPVPLKAVIGDYRIKLPESALVEGENTMELRFKFSTAEPGKNDPRLVSAAFWALAVIPNHIPDPYAFIHATGLKPEEKELQIADGAQIIIPVAPHHQFTFETGKVRGSVEGLEVVVDISAGVTGGEWAEIWRGNPAELSDQRLTVTNSWPQIGKLRILVHSPASGLALPGAIVAIGLKTNSLMDSPWQREKYEAWRKKTNVFFYLVDALRADKLGPFGGDVELSPNISAFGSDSTVYTRAESASSWTLPSAASFLTGYPPLFHQMMTGNVRMGWDHLKPIGFRLAEAGMETFGISQSFVVGPAFGFEKAFGHFIANTQLSGRELRTDDLRGFLRHELVNHQSFSKPVFAYLHTVGTHAPYTPGGKYLDWANQHPGNLSDEDYLPGDFSKKNYGSDAAELAHIEALYDGEVAYEDAVFGRFIDLLKFLGVYDTSMVIFLSDHGEEFYEHGGFDHGRTLYEELTHVPLIIHYPKSSGLSGNIDRRVSTMQIPATIGKILARNWQAPASTGSSLLGMGTAQSDTGHQFLFAEVHQTGTAEEGAIAYNAVWDGDMKCLFSQAGVDQFGNSEAYFRVYDLANDPEELQPEEIDDGSEKACWNALRNWVDEWTVKRDLETAGAGVSIDQEVRDQMKALGYLQ